MINAYPSTQSQNAIKMNTLAQSDLAFNWVMNRKELNSKARNVAILICDIAWAILSATICIPAVVAALSEAKGSTLQKVLGITSAIGTGLDWFVLTTYGGVVFIHSALSKKSEAAIVLFKDDSPTWAKVSQIIASLTLGLATRAPSFAEAVKFTKNKTAGIALGFISAIGEAGLPALGQYLQIELFKKLVKTKYSTNETERKIEEIRLRLISISELALSSGLRLSLEERKNRFSMLFQEQIIIGLNRTNCDLTEYSHPMELAKILNEIDDLELKNDIFDTSLNSEKLPLYQPLIDQAILHK